MKLSAIVIFSLLSVGFISCKKCQTCTTDVTQTTGLINVNISTVSDEYCGDEYDNAPTAGVVVQDAGGGITQTVTITCVDK